jgi:hypothetical protein
MPAPSRQLTSADWAAVRAAWEAGSSNRALHREFGVDESTIRTRAKKDGWQRDPAAAERVHLRAAARTIAAAAEALPPAGPAPHPASRTSIPHPAPRARDPAAEVLADPEARAELRDVAVDAAADVIVSVNVEALRRTQRLASTFDRFLGLVTDVLATPDPLDEEGLKRKAAAMETLFVGKGDGVASALSALARLGESIQNQQRKALGAEDRPKQVQLTGADGGPIATTRGGDGPNLDGMTTAELEILYEAALLVEGKRQRPPIPVPPSDPPVGDGEA